MKLRTKMITNEEFIEIRNSKDWISRKKVLEILDKNRGLLQTHPPHEYGDGEYIDYINIEVIDEIEKL